MINQNFKRLFIGRSISNVGDSLYAIGLSWYIFSLTNSSLWVGILNFALFIPNLFSFLLGDFIERTNKRKLLVFIELGQGLFLLPIILLIAFQMDTTMKASLICIFAFLIATFGMNAYVVQDVLMPEIVTENRLSSASMYMSFSYNAMDYVGNAIGGFLLKVFSVFSLMIIDIISFIASAFLFMKIEMPEVPENDATNIEREKTSIFSGIALIRARKDLLLITLFGGLANFFFGGLAVFAVLIGKELGGAGFYGLLLAIESIGVTIGTTLFAKLLLKHFKLGSLFPISCFGMGLCLTISCLLKNNYLFLGFWAIAFMFQGLNRVVTTPYLQASLVQGQRAKFFSAFNTLTVAPLPIGSLFFGKLATIIDWQLFIISFAIYMVIFGLLFTANRKIKNFVEGSSN